MRILWTAFLCCGCADFSVAPARGPDAPGVHFFLPKPYVLFWWEREIMWKSGTPIHSLVPRSQVILLPDVSQRYAITQRAWCAKGDFSYHLKDGWRLEAINGTMDTGEFLRAVKEPAAAGAVRTRLARRRPRVRIPPCGARGADGRVRGMTPPARLCSARGRRILWAL